MASVEHTMDIKDAVRGKLNITIRLRGVKALRVRMFCALWITKLAVVIAAALLWSKGSVHIELGEQQTMERHT